MFGPNRRGPQTAHVVGAAALQVRHTLRHIVGRDNRVTVNADDHLTPSRSNACVQRSSRDAARIVQKASADMPAPATCQRFPWSCPWTYRRPPGSPDAPADNPGPGPAPDLCSMYFASLRTGIITVTKGCTRGISLLPYLSLRSLGHSVTMAGTCRTLTGPVPLQPCRIHQDSVRAAAGFLRRTVKGSDISLSVGLFPGASRLSAQTRIAQVWTPSRP